MCDSNGAPFFPNITDAEIEELFSEMGIDENAEPDIEVKKEIPKCECGADSAHGAPNPFHSPWCRKYKSGL